MGYKNRAAALTALAAEIGATPSVKELPDVTVSDEGDVLKVNAQGKWDKGSFEKELPDVDSTDEGKVLTVDSNGDWVAADLPTPETPAGET